MVDRIPKPDVLRRANMHNFFILLPRAQVRWATHIVWLQNSRWPKQLLDGELHQGKQTVGGQRKRYREGRKVSFKDLSIGVHSRETHALNRLN